ncbi:hypothetical protein ACQJBY_001943 [Aegilops geniculata]
MSSTSTAGTPTPRSGSGRSTPRARSSTPCSATSSPPAWGPAVALAWASDGAVDWSRPDAPAVEEVVGPDGVDFVTGDGDLAFGSGVRVRDMVGPFELVVYDGTGGGRAELQLPPFRKLRHTWSASVSSYLLQGPLLLPPRLPL